MGVKVGEEVKEVKEVKEAYLCAIAEAGPQITPDPCCTPVDESVDNGCLPAVHLKAEFRELLFGIDDTDVCVHLCVCVCVCGEGE